MDDLEGCTEYTHASFLLQHRLRNKRDSYVPTRYCLMVHIPTKSYDYRALYDSTPHVIQDFFNHKLMLTNRKPAGRKIHSLCPCNLQ